ncbi:MAG: hypothetical protein HYW69_02030 [Candidatus Nealsonbacteria bacterium]|nr:hypothetical protein [Candidatus Nealsonbacteria bacterium]
MGSRTDLWAMLYLLGAAIALLMLILYFIYLYTSFWTSIEILNDILPKIFERNQTIKEAGDLLPK